MELGKMFDAQKSKSSSGINVKINAFKKLWGDTLHYYQIRFDIKKEASKFNLGIKNVYFFEPNE